ncbi:tetratricopeptide repeat-containing sensor histidine kinase [Paucihalobacter sp.]|uniref:tetratricopeptide repeat-containing sensor histidine kinase n=1 Tax=Paucihalobacter sp. TaxID=2850405 RepID=UPI002FE0081B
MKLFIVTSVICFFSICRFFAQTNYSSRSLDSILKLNKILLESNPSLETAIEYANISLKLSKDIRHDSLIVVSYRRLAYYYLNSNNQELFLENANKGLKLAVQGKFDYDLGYLNSYKGFLFMSNQVNDSAYYYYSNAVERFEKSNNLDQVARSLMNLSKIQRQEKDFIGSDESAIRAIKIIQQKPISEDVLDDLWILNNGLALNSRGLKIYPKSLTYFDEAIAIANKMKDGLYNKLYALNNKAFTLRESSNYKEALGIYNEILTTKNLFEDDPSFYALILESKAITKFLIDGVQNDEIETMFDRALVISDSLQDDVTKLGVIVSKANYYEGIENKEKALQFANETYELAKRIKQNEIFLESLNILSRLNEGEEGKKYLNEHIRLSDSLLNHERNIRNKFARIKFETDQLEAENKRITRERIWLIILSIVLLLAAVLVYIIIAQRTKNKELKFIQEQQRANEEIYNLMLSQQDKIDEARVNEKKRISQELHDGVLGRMFGTRLILDSLNFNTDADSIKTRAQHIKDLMKIEQDIRQVSHDLNTDFISGSGFTEILFELIDKQTKAYNLTYDFESDDFIHWETVSNKTKINLYRITQESLQNIYKHAKAKHVKIGIKLKNDVICLTIQDDGVGFDIAKSKKGIGHKNINARIAELGGNVEFESIVNKGTSVTVTVPLLNLKHESATN